MKRDTRTRLLRLLRAFIYPHVAVILLLLPVSVIGLVLALSRLESSSLPAILIYMVAFYTLAVVSARVPRMIAFFKRVKEDNRILRAYFSDPRLRIKVSLYGALILNIAYGVFNFFLGLKHISLWYYSLSAYYVIIAAVRVMLLSHTRAYAPGERRTAELKRYRATGVLLLPLNLALTAIIAFTVWQNRTVRHHEITVIAMAAYTFTAFTLAIINMGRFRKYDSPVFSAVKAIGLVCASVSMLSLASSMLITFGDGVDPVFNRITLGSLGGAVSITVLALSVYMTVKGTRGIRESKTAAEKAE